MEISDIGRMVRRKRKAFGLTQAEAAGMCNVGVRFLSELENGKPTLQIGKVFHVLASFGLEVTLTERTGP